jgi:hypothetical protein
MPFILLLLGTLQIAMFYMVQSALDSGVMRTADTLRSSFTTGATPALPTGAALKSAVATNAGGLIHNDSTLAAEVRQLITLDAGPVAIADKTTDYGNPMSTLVIRAQAKVFTFAPGFSALANVRSSAIVRRQGY